MLNAAVAEAAMMEAAALGAEHRGVPWLSRAPQQTEPLSTVGLSLQEAEVDLLCGPMAAEPELRLQEAQVDLLCRPMARPVPAAAQQLLQADPNDAPDLAAQPLLGQVFVVDPLAASASIVT